MHICARVVAKAGAGEILVTGMVKDLVAGTPLTFQDRDSHELRGVPGSWRLVMTIGYWAASQPFWTAWRRGTQ